MNSDTVSNAIPITPTWKFYLYWVLANGAGVRMGVVISLFLALSFGLFGAPLPEGASMSEWKSGIFIFLFSISFGGVVGLFQWLVIFRYLQKSGFWFITSIIATFLSFVITILIGPISPGLLFFWLSFGGMSGIFQWFIIRGQLEYSWSWILANFIAGGISGIFLPSLGIFGGSIGRAFMGIFTGGILYTLFQKTSKNSVSQIVA